MFTVHLLRFEGLVLCMFSYQTWAGIVVSDFQISMCVDFLVFISITKLGQFQEASVLVLVLTIFN